MHYKKTHDNQTPGTNWSYDERLFATISPLGKGMDAVEMVEPDKKHPRKPGRPRAIPKEYEPLVVELYSQGNGYRAIARILREGYRLNPDFTTVRRTLIRLGIIPDSCQGKQK